MLYEDGHGCGRIGSWVAVLCAALGAVTAQFMLGGMSGGWLELLFPPSKEILAVLAGLFITAAVLGNKAGVYLCRRTDNLAINVLVGLGVAFGSITAAVLAGLLISFLGEADLIFRDPNFHPANLVLAPIFMLFFVFLYGGIPAVFLAFLYGWLVRNRLRKLNGVVV